MKRTLFLFCSLFVLCVICGCGNGMKPLGGKVTFSDNGEPLKQGTVIFQTETYQARGNLNESGVYQLGSLKEKDGIPAGTYSVFVSGTEVEKGQDKNGMPTGFINLVDPKFNSTECGLTFTVDGKTNTFDFKVDRPKK
ncbi:MAG: hypothetical protein Q4G69_03535 [Planctomycetia bacterium]|nr:hypothetical protein [Planctomycetia bacterium]